MRAASGEVLRDVLLERASSDPERLAYADGDAQLTFAELAERACVRALALGRMGVAQGDRVAIAMSPGLALVEVFWALQLIGGVPCIFNPAAPAPTLARRIERIGPGLVVTDERAAETTRARGSLAAAEIDRDDLAHLQLTSGTSGEPRATMVRHRNVIAFLRGSGQDAHVLSGDVLLGWLPPWHDFGLVRFIIGAVYHGVSYHMLAPAISSIPEWLETVSRVDATVTGAPDFAYRLAVRMADPSRVDLSSLRAAVNGGEPVRWSSIERFETRFAVPGIVLPGYGLGEATLGVSMQRAGEPRVIDARGNVSCGRPTSGFEVRAGRDLDNPDEILVRGEAVCAGYLDAPEETSRLLRGGWLHTGDSGYLDSSGRLYVLGRRSGMLKRAGATISPRELEEAAERVDGVRLAASTTITSDGQDDQIIVVVEEATPGGRSAVQIRTEVSKAIIAAVGFAPNRIHVVPRQTIPRTENGKVRHASLAAALPPDAPG